MSYEMVRFSLSSHEKLLSNELVNTWRIRKLRPISSATAAAVVPPRLSNPQLVPGAELSLCGRVTERVPSSLHFPPPSRACLLRPPLIPALPSHPSTPWLASSSPLHSSFPRSPAAMAAFVQSAALTRTLGASASVVGSPVVCTKRAAPAVAAPVSTTIEAAKHAQFKAAKKANRCRPKKHRLSDINRKPPAYNVEPLRAEGYVLCLPAWTCAVLRAYCLRSIGVLWLRLAVQLAVCALPRLCVWPGVRCRLVYAIRVVYYCLSGLLYCDMRCWCSDLMVCLLPLCMLL